MSSLKIPNQLLNFVSPIFTVLSSTFWLTTELHEVHFTWSDTAPDATWLELLDHPSAPERSPGSLVDILKWSHTSPISSLKRWTSSGLDPSRMPVETPTDYFLDKDDADFVDVVHTNGGMDYDDRAIIDPSGHVDFYANGGHHQPGCEDSNRFEFRFWWVFGVAYSNCPISHPSASNFKPIRSKLWKINVWICSWAGLYLDHCNHLRAKDLFAESINTKVGFRALRCDNYEDFQKGLCDGNESELMGDHTQSKYSTTDLEIEFIYWRRLLLLFQYPGHFPLLYQCRITVRTRMMKRIIRLLNF